MLYRYQNAIINISYVFHIALCGNQICFTVSENTANNLTTFKNCPLSKNYNNGRPYLFINYKSVEEAQEEFDKIYSVQIAEAAEAVVINNVGQNNIDSSSMNTSSDSD